MLVLFKKQAHRVDQQRDAVLGHRCVVFVDHLVEGETVLEARATTALHKHAQLQVGVAFFLDQLLDLVGSAVGEHQRRRQGVADGADRGGQCLCNRVHGRVPSSRIRVCSTPPASVLAVHRMSSGRAVRRRSSRPGAFRVTRSARCR